MSSRPTLAWPIGDMPEKISKSSLATRSYAEKCIETARRNPRSMVRFAATQALDDATPGDASSDEDFVTFTTGINTAGKGDKLDH
ncbi:hypothetical protein F4825DRAFT_446100 [Nemania diffusa]|nr:hypothetical protein F4825DRAFT_446100 [Nemania diffusa]